MAVSSRGVAGVVAVVLLSVGCGSDSQAPHGAGASPATPEAPERPVSPPAYPVIGSAAIDAEYLPAAGAVARSATAAFVSARPQSISGTWAVVLHNPRTNERVTVDLVDGGFDPVAITAAEGDSVTVSASGSAGASGGTAIKRRAPVRVVRTSPAPTQTDIPLNARVRVVFSAPVTLASAAGEVHLRLGGSEVSGVVSLADANGMEVELAPSIPLAPQTNYELEIGAAIADVAGNTMSEPVTVSFRTGDPLPPVPQDNLVLLAAATSWSMYGGVAPMHAASADGQETSFLGLWGATDLAWSPDSRWIAFAANGLHGERPSSYNVSFQNILVRSAVGDAGAAFRQLTHDGFNFRPRWRPDGGVIVFDHFGYDPSQWGSYSVNPDGQGRRKLKGVIPLDWSPSGTEIVGFDWAATGVWKARADGTGRVLLAADGNDPRWAPAGNLIAFAASNGIYVIAPDGSGRRQVASSTNWLGGPVWSPDGERIIYFEEDSTESVRAFRVNLDGTGVMQLPLPADLRVFSWRR